MECPHCQQPLPTDDCPNCGQKALTGANFCQNCGHLLPPGESEGRKLLTCSTCGQHLLAEAKYCHSCGESVESDTGDGGDYAYDPGKRVACSDGNCIGIIGPDGKCTECGKPYDPNASDED